MVNDDRDNDDALSELDFLWILTNFTKLAQNWDLTTLTQMDSLTLMQMWQPTILDYCLSKRQPAEVITDIFSENEDEESDEQIAHPSRNEGRYNRNFKQIKSVCSQRIQVLIL